MSWGNCCERFRVTSPEFRVRGERRVGRKSFYRLLTTDFMTWIKICGTTNLEDALTAVDAGADALGFVFYQKSPRKIDLESAREIVEKLPLNIEKVGVFVDEPVAKILRTVDRAGLTAAQLHGVKSRRPEFIRALKTGRDLKLFLALPATEINSGLDWPKNGETGISAVFFDSGT